MERSVLKIVVFMITQRNTHGSTLVDWNFVTEIKTFVLQRSRVLREANGGFDTMETARYRDVTYDEVLRRTPRIEIGLGLS